MSDLPRRIDFLKRIRVVLCAGNNAQKSVGLVRLGQRTITDAAGLDRPLLNDARVLKLTKKILRSMKIEDHSHPVIVGVFIKHKIYLDYLDFEQVDEIDET